jgi:hypothetical protein
MLDSILKFFGKKYSLALLLPADPTALDSSEGGAFVREQAQCESECGIRETNRYQHSFSPQSILKGSLKVLAVL